ncbi:DUF3572 domain-containing protein [Oceaniglobus ichthyenteri]|uniref:DUF3572 domain-containing protein n=1 Tax=Oceaniglobus ichthyenteri TaxID=2136177 RepID=UPI000D35A407|nr:DUF3572 domain-containing protein [Oceaniglobus ichthyenteri]
MRQETAETLAVQALGWLAGEDDLLGVFMGATGVGVDDLRARVGDPDFLASVLDFLLMDDAWVVRFCDTVGHPYETVMQARAALPGGGQVHWT